MKKKLLSVTLVITMLLSMLTTMGVTASAAEYTSGLYTETTFFIFLNSFEC